MKKVYVIFFQVRPLENINSIVKLHIIGKVNICSFRNHSELRFQVKFSIVTIGEFEEIRVFSIHFYYK